VPETLCGTETTAEVKPAGGDPSAGSTGRKTLGGVILRRIALWRYTPGITRAQVHLHLAAGEVDDIRTRAELFYATSEEYWQEGPEGLAYAAVLDELRRKACVLRETALPDVGRLR